MAQDNKGAIKFLVEEGKIIFTSRKGLPKKGIESFWQKMLKKSGEAQIKIKRPQGTVLRFPLVLGIFGSAAFPRLVSWGALGLLLARCSLEMEWR